MKCKIKITNNIEVLRAAVKSIDPALLNAGNGLKAFSQMKEVLDALLFKVPRKTEYFLSKDTGAITIHVGEDKCIIQVYSIAGRNNRLTPIRFLPDEYTENKYGIDETIVYFPEGIDAPFYGLEFAKRSYNEKGEPCFESFWLRDHNVAWEDSLAKKMLDDPKMKFYASGRRNAEDQLITTYILPLKNPDCIMFKPTVYSPVSDTINVDSDITAEILLSFGDGYVLPIRHMIKTGGPGALNMADIMETVLRNFDNPYDLEEFLVESLGKGIRDRAEGEGIQLMLFSENGERPIEKTFFADPAEKGQDRHDLEQAITSIRLVELNEQIRRREEHE